MSSRFKKIKVKKQKKHRMYHTPPQSNMKHSSFNIFTRDCKNRTVTPPYPMTLEEAQAYYDAMCIGYND